MIWWSWAAATGRTRHSTRPSTAPWRSNRAGLPTACRGSSARRGKPRMRLLMKTNLFKPMVAGWSAKLRWSKDELSKATKSLAAISAANAGEIAPDAQLDAETGDGFTLRRGGDALGRKVNPYAELLRGKTGGPGFGRPPPQQAELWLSRVGGGEWGG